jgi:hypothetical protein
LERDDESFSVWLGKYEMMMFTLYAQSKKTAYDCFEIALEDEAHSSWKNWAVENPKSPRTGKLSRNGPKKLEMVEQEEDISTRQLQGLT